MRLDLPYAYEFQCIPPGHRQPKYATVRGTALFELRETDGHQAPVACALRDEHRTFEGGSFVSLRVGPDDFAARLRAVGSPGVWGQYEDSLAEVLIGRCSDSVTYLTKPFGLPTEEAAVKTFRESRRGVVREPKDDGEEARLRAQRTWTDGFLVIDGVVHARATEPHLRLELMGRTLVLSSDDGPSNGAKWSVGFSADRHAEAVEQGRRIASSKRGRGFRDDSTRRPITVTGAAPLAFDEADDMASWFVHELSFGFGYGFGGDDAAREAMEDVRRRRLERDPSWAVDYLDHPALRRGDMGYRATNRPAEARREFAAACAMSTELWDAALREHAVARTLVPPDDPALMGLSF